MYKLKVLVACEESQTVCKAFRKLGHEAYSCDILPCSGGHPEWHIKDDIRRILFHPNNKHDIPLMWDLIIAHPPCTRLTNSGVCWLEIRNLWDELDDACKFFNIFKNYHIQYGIPVMIENPIPHKYAVEKIGKYTQLIQPYQFGHTERKATCLWLMGLPKLKPTNNVYEQMIKLPKNIQQRVHYTPPGPERAKIRSKTFEGIAEAMAQQWSEYIVALKKRSA